ncbi:MAG: protoglobin domain-containing protein [Gammaproteobacteria bacterium]|nr:protoglobin domain-containing protein [Gammaproteobacteria bacterium]
MSVAQTFYGTISKLVDFQQADWETLANEAEVIKTWAPELITVFYDTLYSIEETTAVFHEGERAKLENTLQNWIVEILSGDQGDKFWNHQRYIALLHIKRGTKNLYMLGMMNRLQQVFISKCMANYEQEKAVRVYMAFLRLSGMVAGIIAQCYDEVTETSMSVGLKRVGLNEALVTRIKTMQIDKMLQEAKEA